MLEQHELDLAAGFLADHLDVGAGGQPGGGDPVEDRGRGRRLDAERLQFAHVLHHGGGVAPGPAGDDGVVDGDLGVARDRAALQDEGKPSGHGTSRVCGKS